MEIEIMKSATQQRAEVWANLFRDLRDRYPEASNYKICEAIAGKQGYTAQAVYLRLCKTGVIIKNINSNG